MIRAVIGAQFGDEGKGLITDYYSHHEALVVRYNGGAQAGHTVVLPDGRRHVFAHFGSGSFKAACTLLSRFFVINPVLFREEHEAPTLQGVRRTVYVDPRARVTTPFDMMLNCAAEEARGANRHGSCGVGINETVTRDDAGVDFDLMVNDLISDGLLRARLTRIQQEWVPQRCAQLGMPVPTDSLLAVTDRFIEDCHFFLDHVTIVNDASAIKASPELIFEGAQGLMLDELADGFPHVTRSRTGLPNVIALLRDAGRRHERLDVSYVTRCYTTRHGAGPLTGELSGHPWGWTGPETNVENKHQGQFRYAHLNGPALLHAIVTDLAAVGCHNVDATLNVTCLDQCKGEFDPEAFARAYIGLPLELASYGPTRDDVEVIHKAAARRAVR